MLENSPSVLFAGNQPAFAAKKIQAPSTAAVGAGGGGKTEGEEGGEVLLVSVPSFAATGEAVLVDLVTLECTPLRFRSLVVPPAASMKDE